METLNNAKKAVDERKRRVWSWFTFEAATSCAVLAAISWEHTISSSNFPFPCTTMSAASLGTKQHREQINSKSTRRCFKTTLTPTTFCISKSRQASPVASNLHHDSGAPSYCFGGRDQALSPAGVLGIKFLHGGCPLVDRKANADIEEKYLPLNLLSGKMNSNE